ncbi:MAG: 2-succinyl-5-enolpyruvyl-6-hydroxy-3-cyclohexene-1-carboxylic-acid synthase [Bacteroidota bacterium]
MINDAPNINHLWTYLIVEELVRCGVDTFFIAPGSRSTPFTTAVARHPKATSFVHFDERGTAFAALGFARATGRPAGWITTSGTAVANGLPAVVEAAIEGVPMLLLTADRPPELRRTGANQTITQPGIFGDYLSWAFDGPPPTVEIAPAFVLTTIDQAVHRSQEGPVHLNWMFREPLAPGETHADFTAYAASLKNWEQSDAPFTAYPATVRVAAEPQLTAIADHIRASARGVVIAGRMRSPAEGAAVVHLAKKSNWPVFADVGAQVDELDRHVIVNQDFLVDTPAFREGPDMVLQFGKRYTSKKVLQWLERTAPSKHVVVDGLPDRLDPTHNVTTRIEGDIATVALQLAEHTTGTDENGTAWLSAWQEADAGVAAKLDTYFAGATTLTEPLLARTLGTLLARETLVVGNSMPVRDMDVFAILQARPTPVILNRGASGIDGTVATAAGVVAGTGQCCTVLLGDLTLLHDLNSLAILRSLPAPVIIIVINNDGGGIFSFLPISSYNDIFESHFAAPHGLNFGFAAEMFGLDYAQTHQVDTFSASYARALAGKKSTIIEVHTNRKENLACHRAIAKILVNE